MRALVGAFLIILLLSSFGAAQEYMCGDVNYDSALNIPDIVFIFDYLFGGGPPTALPDPIYANWDGAEYLTIQDVQRSIWYAWVGYVPPDCSAGPPLVPIIDSSMVLLYTDRIRPGTTNADIALTTYFPLDLGFELPLRIRIGDSVPEIDSVLFFPYKSSYPFTVFTYDYMLYPESGEIAFGLAAWGIESEPNQFCTIQLMVPASDVERAVSIEWTRLTPLQATVSDSNCIYPMLAFVTGYGDTYEPVLVPTCCITAGDANDDGQTNIGDAVFIISYAFKGGPAPYCMSQADANFDTEVNVGDAVFLINYIFRDGPAPLCGLF